MMIPVFHQNACEQPVGRQRIVGGEPPRPTLGLACGLEADKDRLLEPPVWKMQKELDVWQFPFIFFRSAALPAMRNFYMSAREIDEFFNHPFYRELIACRSFLRLRDISFLGAIDYITSPKRHSEYYKRQSRYDHSLGVACLALRYSQAVGLSLRDELPLVAAALLHDIGHAPLSHTLEHIFSEKFGINHHSAAEMRLTSGSTDAVEIRSIFSSFKVDLDEIQTLLYHPMKHKHGDIFGHPINIDTIEGIFRSRTYIGGQVSLISKEAVLAALVRPSVNEKVLDRFWEMKNIVYTNLIQGPLGALADEIAREYMTSNIYLFSRKDFSLGETSFRRKHPSLFERLALMKRDVSGFGIRQPKQSRFLTAKRYFKIDPTFEAGNPRRYLQQKVNIWV